MLLRLVSLLDSSTSNVADCAAAVLACYCQGPEEQGAVAAAGAVAPLVALLSSPQRAKQEAALEALAALSRGNADTSAAMLQDGSVVSSLLRAIKQGGTPHTRFVAAVCLANLSRNLPVWHTEHSQQVTGPPNRVECLHGWLAQHAPCQPPSLLSPLPLAALQDLQQAVLPVLVRLLGEAELAEDVPGALCQLVEHSVELQQAAADADAIVKLAAILRCASLPACLLQALLLALIHSALQAGLWFWLEVATCGSA